MQHGHIHFRLQLQRHIYQLHSLFRLEFFHTRFSFTTCSGCNIDGQVLTPGRKRELTSTLRGKDLHTMAHGSFPFVKLPPELRIRIIEIALFDRIDFSKSCNVCDVELDIYPVIEFQFRSPETIEDSYQGRPCLQAMDFVGRQTLSGFPEYKSLSLGLFSVSKQVQLEAESVFFAKATFRSKVRPSGADRPWRSVFLHEFLEHIPKRNRRLIKRVEQIFLFDGNSPWATSYPPSARWSQFDWCAFLQFLAQECLTVQTLKLFSPNSEKIILVAAADLVRAKSFFRKMPDTNNSLNKKICYKAVGSAWQHNISRVKYSTNSTSAVTTPTPAIGSFPFLKLSSLLRQRVYRYALLPADLKVHPFLKSWYDLTTCNVIPLFSTCRVIRQEAEKVLYGEAIFALVFESSKYALRLLCFFQKLEPRLRGMVRRVSINDISHTEDDRDLIKYLAREMSLDNLTFCLDSRIVKMFNKPTWPVSSRQQPFWLDWSCAIRRIKKVDFRVVGEKRLASEAREWLKNGPKEGPPDRTLLWAT